MVRQREKTFGGAMKPPRGSVARCLLRSSCVRTAWIGNESRRQKTLGDQGPGKRPSYADGSGLDREWLVLRPLGSRSSTSGGEGGVHRKPKVTQRSPWGQNTRTPGTPDQRVEMPVRLPPHKGQCPGSACRIPGKEGSMSRGPENGGLWWCEIVVRLPA